MENHHGATFWVATFHVPLYKFPNSSFKVDTISSTVQRRQMSSVILTKLSQIAQLETSGGGRILVLHHFLLAKRNMEIGERWVMQVRWFYKRVVIE